MRKSGRKSSHKKRLVVPDPALPDMCFYAIHPEIAEIMKQPLVVAIRRGEMGYYSDHPDKEPWSNVAKLMWNVTMGITDAQCEAMYHGSLYGWGCRAARVKHWEDQFKRHPMVPTPTHLEMWANMPSVKGE